MSQNNVLGLDVGSRRIGVAITSLQARLPAPYAVIDRKLSPDTTSVIKDIISREDVGLLVVGLPRGLDGQNTAQTNETREFAANLSKEISIPLIMQDEAGTSVEAEARLQERGKPYGKGDIDSEAATIILRDYLAASVEQTA